MMCQANFVRILKITFLIQFLYFSSNAQKLWDGGGDAINWSDADNWVGNVLPTAGDSVVIDADVNVLVDGNFSARGITIGANDTLVHQGQLTLTTGITVEPDGVFIWESNDLEWPDLVNHGTMNVIMGSSSKYLRNDIHIQNAASGIMRFFGNQNLYFVAGVLENFGTIYLDGAIDILNSSSGMRKIINQSSGAIHRLEGSEASTSIQPDFVNAGTLHVEVGMVTITGLKTLKSGCALVTNDTTEILFQGSDLRMEGLISGNASGEIIIDCQFEPVGASINFAEDGFMWYRNRLTGGDTLTNQGIFHLIAGSYKYIGDTTVLINQGTLLMDDQADLFFDEGILINENLIELGNSSDFINNIGSYKWCQNQIGGSVLKKSTGTATLSVLLRNHGIIQVDEGVLKLDGIKNFFDGTSLVTNDTTEILMNGADLYMEGTTSGNASGEIIIDCQFEPVDATINFAENGFMWYRNRLTGGDTLTNLGIFHLIAGSYKYIGDTTVLINQGTMLLDDNAEIWFDVGFLINKGLIELGNSSNFKNNVGSYKWFENQAGASLLKKSIGATTIGVDLRNQGVLQVNDGAMNFSGIKNLYSGTMLVTNDTSMLGFVSSPLHISGEVGGDASGTITLDCPIFPDGGILNFQESGLEWYRNAIQGGDTLTNQGQLNVIAGSYKYISDSSVLKNEGSLIFQSNAALYLNSGSIINEGNLVLGINTDFFNNSGVGVLKQIVNRTGATITKSSTGTSTIQPTFIHNGEIFIDQGLMNFTGPKWFGDGSQIHIISGATMLFGGNGLLTFNGLSSGNVDGTMTIDCEFESVNGSIDFTGDGISWFRGTFSGNGVLENYGLFNVISGNYKYMTDSAAMWNNGSLFFATNGDIYMSSAARIVNGDSVIMSGGSRLYEHTDTMQFVQNLESGVWVKSNIGSTAIIDVEFENRGTLIADVNTIQFNHDVINTSSGKWLGTGTIDLPPAPHSVMNKGTTSPGLSPGILSFTGSFVMSDSAILEVELNGLTQGIDYDVVASSAVASVSGYIDLTVNFIPTVGDQFDIITAPSFVVCSFQDTVFACYDDEILMFETQCLPNSVRLEYIGLDIADLVCQPDTVYLNLSGTTSLDPFEFFSDTIEDCGFDALSLNFNSVDCSDIGQQSITLTAGSWAGNLTCMTTVTTLDTVKPIAQCGNGLTFYLDANGEVNLTPAQINDGSGDACGINMSLDVSEFDCSDIGNQQVELTVIDPSGNSAECTTSITIADNTPPDLLVQDVTLTLDANTGAATLTPSMVDNGTTDNCSISNLSVSQTSFNCSHVGSNAITFTALDVNGNQSQTMVNVEVEDNTPPDLMVQDVTITLDANTGAATMTPSMVDNGTSDNCGISSLMVSQTSFNCSHVGSNAITFTALDVNGNQSQTMVNVKVEDNTPPDLMVQDVTITLDANTGAATMTPSMVDNGTSDNCGISSLMVSQTSFNCSHVGSNSITFTALDVNGNQSQTMVNVEVEDKTPPIVQVQDVTVTLNVNNGTASINTGQVDNGSSDNCGIQSMMLSRTSFSCSDDDTELITLTVTDVNGNVNSADATVTIIKPLKQVAWVSESATGNNNGLSKAHAFNDLQDALEGTGCVEDVTEVRLVEGTYLPSNQGANNPLSTFLFPDPITILGGYPVGSGARNPDINVSILSGDIGVASNISDNVYHVVTIPASANNVIIDGVKISDGNARASGHRRGGGIKCHGNVQLRQTTVTNNRSDLDGAAIFITSPNGVLSMDQNSKIEMNLGGVSGLHHQIGSELILLNGSEINP